MSTPTRQPATLILERSISVRTLTEIEKIGPDGTGLTRRDRFSLDLGRRLV